MMNILISTRHQRTLPLTSLALAFFVSLVIVSPLMLRAADLTAESVLSLVNTARSADGLKPLAFDEALNRAALAKAEDMFEKGYFSHNSPKGETPWYWVKQSGYNYQSAGENLAINYASAEKQHAAWMKSATHRANIMNAKYQHTGIAVKTGKMNGESVTVTVQVFGAPRGAAAAPRAKQETARPATDPVRVTGVEALPITSPASAQLAEPETLPAIQSADSALSENRLPGWMSWLPDSLRQTALASWAVVIAFVLIASILAALPAVLVGRAAFRLFRYWRERSQEQQVTNFPSVERQLPSPGRFTPLLSVSKRRMV